MAENKVKDGNYYVVQSFMVKEMQLKGLEKDVYAIIYGFSQDGEQKFTGSLQYLADWTNSTKQGIMKVLANLINKGFIKKEEKHGFNGVNSVVYYTTQLYSGIQHSCMGGMQHSCINNIDINNINNNIDNSATHKKFIIPTLQEVEEYCNERENGLNAQHFIDFYESKGWMVGKNKMKDWKACIRTWESTDKTHKNLNEKEIKNLYDNIYEIEI